MIKKRTKLLAPIMTLSLLATGPAYAGTAYTLWNVFKIWFGTDMGVAACYWLKDKLNDNHAGLPKAFLVSGVGAYTGYRLAKSGVNGLRKELDIITIKHHENCKKLHIVLCKEGECNDPEVKHVDAQEGLEISQE